MTKISALPASISLQKEPMIDLSLASTDVDTTSHSYDDEQDFEYLNDESTRRALDPRWDEQSKTSDALPSITRRRRSVDDLDDSNRDTSNCSTKLGGRISKLRNSPTNSPRSSLGEFLHAANTQGLKSAPLMNDDDDDNLSLDDTIYTVEDEIEFMCVVMESTVM